MEGGFNSGDFFSHQSEIKVLAVGVSSEARPWLAHGHLLIVSPHGLFSVPAHPWCFSWYPNVLFLKGHQSEWIRPTLTVSLCLNWVLSPSEQLGFGLQYLSLQGGGGDTV